MLEENLDTSVMKPIPEYEGIYSATTDGRIYRHPRKRSKPGFLKLRTSTDYQRVPLMKDGVRVDYYVHRLVASAFLPNPLDKPQVNHMNCIKHDNQLENLEWVTWKENWDHARDHGAYRGIMLSEEEQVELYGLYCTGDYTRQQLANQFGISLSSVHRHIRKHRGMSLA